MISELISSWFSFTQQGISWCSFIQLNILGRIGFHLLPENITGHKIDQFVENVQQSFEDFVHNSLTLSTHGSLNIINLIQGLLYFLTVSLWQFVLEPNYNVISAIFSYLIKKSQSIRIMPSKDEMISILVIGLIIYVLFRIQRGRRKKHYMRQNKSS